MRRFTVRPRLWILLVSAIAVASLIPTLIAMASDEPAYTVELKDGDFEIRRYAPLLAAEVTVTGERSAAINQGFRLLADFIFGNNTAKTKIDMTTPVTQQKSEKIAMTAPVTQQSAGDAWKVRFMMPAEYTSETLPVPNDKRVTIIAEPEKRFAVIRFSGWSSDSNLSEHKAMLESWVKQKGLKPAGPPIAAFYNPPWSIPFLRRNEYLIELAPG
jgi:effector-binding domain-containing protein